MSRSGYSDDWGDDGPPPKFWRQAVMNAIKGKRGQGFLRDFIATLDAMPVKRLAAHSFRTEVGEVCSLGAVCVAHNVSMEGFTDKWGDMMDRDKVGAALNISPAMAAEIVYMNDEGDWRGRETEEQRWQRMRKWAEENLTVKS